MILREIAKIGDENQTRTKTAVYDEAVYDEAVKLTFISTRRYKRGLPEAS